MTIHDGPEEKVPSPEESSMSFKPTIYLKDKCPFCFKVRVAIIETGLGDDVIVKDFVPGDDQEAGFRETLAPKLEKVSFPAAEIEPGLFIADSDGIVAALAARAGKTPEDLPVLDHYLRGPFASMMTLYKENGELKKQLA
jgi:glutathione S-transferase